jgi:hypothetical protein
MKWVVKTAYITEIRNAYRILFGEVEEKRELGRSKQSQENDLKNAP